MRNNAAQRRRPIEREYLATLNAAVSLDKWRATCEKAADDALAGDARARGWLSKWLLATEDRPLTVLAAEESGTTSEAAAEAEWRPGGCQSRTRKKAACSWLHSANRTKPCGHWRTNPRRTNCLITWPTMVPWLSGPAMPTLPIGNRSTTFGANAASSAGWPKTSRADAKNYADAAKADVEAMILGAKAVE